MRRERLLLFSFAAWSVIALISAGESYLYSARSGHPVSLLMNLASQGPAWLVWALATGPVIALSRRHPLAWPPKLRALALHTVALAIASAAFTAVYTAASRLSPRPALSPNLAIELWYHFVGWAPFLLMAYACIAGIGHALAYEEQVRREQTEKAALATQLIEAQLGALRMQLQPHFLFNTLNSVAMLIRSADHARAVEMIALLGDVLRALLKTSPALESTLATEVDLLRRYLEIEQVRFGDRLRVAWTVDDDTALAQVPPLILQPVVENALRHGLAPLTDGGELSIRARRAGNQLELEVSDQGVGLAPGFDLTRSPGVGLANVRARLERMYGPNASLDVKPGASKGVCVTVQLPFHLEPKFKATPDA